MRTHYAFGARSATPSLRSSLISPATSSVFYTTPVMPSPSVSYRSSGLLLPRSSSSSFTALSPLRILPPPRLKTRPPRSPYIPSSPLYVPMSYSPIRLNETHRRYDYTSYTPPNSHRPSSNLSPLLGIRGTTSPSRPIPPSYDRPSTHTRLSPSPLASVAGYRTELSIRPSHFKPIEISSKAAENSKREKPIAPQTLLTTASLSPPGQPSIVEKTGELEALRASNKSLEGELVRLRLQIKENERRNRELKRKLMESEAETKVWKAKSEYTNPTQIYDVVKSDVAAPLDIALFDQLDSAADKLSKLNAVNDLKLLQSHMESAIMEISK